MRSAAQGAVLTRRYAMKMHTAIAFFPWLESREPMTVGPIRFIPYVHRKAPGDQPAMTQQDIDGVMRAYSRKPSSNERYATILEVGRWRMGKAATQRTVTNLFQARELIAFSALAKRRLFTHMEYCNYHAYTLVVQRFTAGHTGTFAFWTRRRDGGTNQLWGSDEFAFHIPHHVRADSRLRIDKDLLAALVDLPPALSFIAEAIKEFNSANTDSNDVPEHVEMVMMKSAFEWLLGINERADAFQRAITALLSDVPPATPTRGPLSRQWRKRWNKTRPVEAWARDFCVVRTASAHGMKRDARGASVLGPMAHLAFGAYLFPLLVKKVLKDAGRFKMDDWDWQRLRRVDAYLMHNPFAHRDRRAKHPWQDAENEALIEARSGSFYAAVSAALEKQTSSTGGNAPSP